MSTEPTKGENEEGQSADPKVSDTSKLLDKLFSKSEPANIISVPASRNHAVTHQTEAGETFVRKVVNDSDEQTFQRLVSGADDSAAKVPDRIVNTPHEVAVPPPLHEAVETTPIKTYLNAQDIPTAVDAVESETVKAELLAEATAANHAAKPVIDFPARVSNIKTQNEKIRVRLESLERQE